MPLLIVQFQSRCACNSRRTGVSFPLRPLYLRRSLVEGGLEQPAWSEYV